MSEILSILLNFVLLGLLSAGIYYALRLSKQLTDLRQSRAEMQRFIIDFTNTVQRAESGIHTLKQTARNCGDDLEEQIEKGSSLRDEMRLLIASADQIATRLSDTAAATTRKLAAESPSAPATPVEKQEDSMCSIKKFPSPERRPESKMTSAAEKDLLQALEKLG